MSPIARFVRVVRRLRIQDVEDSCRYRPLAAQTGVLPAVLVDSLEGQDAVLAHREDRDVAIAVGLPWSSACPC